MHAQKRDSELLHPVQFGVILYDVDDEREKDDEEKALPTLGKKKGRKILKRKKVKKLKPPLYDGALINLHSKCVFLCNLHSFS